MAVDKNLNVLIVDDMPAMRKVLSNLLESVFGITKIVPANDGKEAIKVLTEMKVPIGLILCDWNMPGMNGLDFFKNISANAKWKSIPFIMITAESEKGHVMEALKAGVNNYVLKPFEASDIKDRMEKVFGK
jgi:two-component system, chemotaxis family, chemotaxis protein CheY